MRVGCFVKCIFQYLDDASCLVKDIALQKDEYSIIGWLILEMALCGMSGAPVEAETSVS